jgi:hypothetical protein
VPLPRSTARRTLREVMDENRALSSPPAMLARKLFRRKTAVGLSIVVVTLIFLLYIRDVPVGPPTIQVVTYLEPYDQHSPLVKGDPVCLTGAVDAIGKIKRVRASGGKGRKGWEVVMSLDERYQPNIPADSVALLRMPGRDRGNCAFAGDAQLHSFRFLEIDTTIHGRCFPAPHCNVSGKPIASGAVLKSSERLFCGEEDAFCGGLVEFVPPNSWPQALEVFGALGVISAAAMFAIFVRRRRGNGAGQATPLQ